MIARSESPCFSKTGATGSRESPSDCTHSMQPIDLVVEESFSGCRLDVFLAARFPAYSRVYLRKAINADLVQVNGRRAKAAHKLRTGELVSIELPELPKKTPQPEDIPLEILYEDDWLAAINKPPGMVVHPAKGHWKGTLTSDLQFHFDQLSGRRRPDAAGHRSSSGPRHQRRVGRCQDGSGPFRLAAQFEARSTEKEYLAITVGVPDRDRRYYFAADRNSPVSTREEGHPSRSRD